jgi:two-component system, cell cycle sensor histidine kinase and response regulator CckA
VTLSSILLVDDDEEDFLLTRTLVQEFDAGDTTIHWVPDYSSGLSALLENRHDAALIDYRLGGYNGVDLLRTARASGCATPLIMLTTQSGGGLDAEALRAGADDFLVKGEVTAAQLARSLRYAIERRVARERERQRQEHLSALIENCSDVIMTLDADRTIRFASPASEAVSGYHPEEVIGQDWCHDVHPGDVMRLSVELAPCAEVPNDRFSAQYRAKHADGSWRHRELTAVNRLANPAVRAIVLNYRDVTERRRIETALIKSEANYRSSFENAPIGMAHTSLDGRWLRVNRRLRSLLGYSDEQLASTDYPSITHPDDVDGNTTARDQLLAGTLSHYAVEKRYRRADGDYVWVGLTVSLQRDDTGAPQHFITTAEDISGRKQAQQELTHIFDLSPDMICTASFDGYFTRINPAFTRTLGYTAEQLQGVQFLNFVHEDDHAATLRELSRLADGETTFGFTNRYRTAAGVYRLIEWHAKADNDAQVIYAIARDQTDKRLLEDQLRQAQKMEAVGRLAGGVAHDFNNLLTAILGFAEMTMDQLPEDDPRRADVAHILHAGESATALTRQLLAFSRKQILMPVVLDINELLRAVQGILRRLIGEDVELVVTLHAAPLHVHADRGQLEQVVMNLAVNARDAMPTGGVLRIETDVVHLDGAFAAAHPGALTGAHARLRLTDTGTGMAPEVLAHLFEPFFTTKEPGKGTGLGLATVYGIVKQSEGYVSAESVEGHGTTFFVYLPLVDKPVDCVIDTPVPQTLHGGETILVVEDQPEVREVIRNILERRGYQMLEAHDGASALERLRAQHEPVDLIVTDVVMPGMSGRELIARLDDRDVHVRVLYMSGYTDDEIVRRGVLDTGIDFLHKPFTREQLLTKIRAVLDRPAGARSEA